MNRLSVIMMLVLITFSAASQAEKVLTKELIMSFQHMSEQWEALEVNYPELSSLEDFDLYQPDKIIAQLKHSKAYPKIKSMLDKHGFSNVDEYYDVAMRVMGGLMNYQMQNMPQGIDIDSMMQMLKQNIAQMKASNAPSSMVDEMKQQLADMEKNMTKMKAAMKNTSTADKQFFNDNAKWVMSVLDEQ